MSIFVELVVGELELVEAGDLRDGVEAMRLDNALTSQ